VPIRVVDVPRFDPATLDYSPRASGVELRALALGTAAVVAATGSVGIWLVVRRARARGRPQRELRRLYERVTHALDTEQAPEELARVVTEGLAEYLSLVAGRPRGALTPAEAEEAVVEVTGDQGLGRRAGTLIALCDQARFGGRAPYAERLIEPGKRLFEDLGRLTSEGIVGRDGQETPREAVDAALL
jgi:hypothetical protein